VCPERSPGGSSLMNRAEGRVGMLEKNNRMRTVKLLVAAPASIIAGILCAQLAQANTNKSLPAPNSVVFSVRDLSRDSKMRMAFAKLVELGVIKRQVSAEQSSEGYLETTKPLAFYDTTFGPIIITGTEYEGGWKNTPSEFRVHRLSYNERNSFSYIKTDGGYFHYGSEGRMPEHNIGYDYSNDLTLSFLNRGGGSGCFASNFVFISIKKEETISSELMISSIYGGINNRTVEFNGRIVGSVKNESLTIEVTHKDYTDRAGKTVFSKNTKFIQKYIYSNGRWSLEQGSAQIEVC